MARLETLLRQPRFLICIQLLAFWPVWLWYLRRMWDTSDEPYGIVALCTALGLLLLKSRRGHVALVGRKTLLWAASISLLYATTYGFLPMLVRASLAIGALTCLIGHCAFKRAFPAGLWMLMMLSLPLLASMQFYIGFPLRLVVGKMAALLLRLTGLPVVSDGTLLRWAGDLVGIDTPCSGVKMVWAASYLAATIACLLDLGFVRTLRLLTIAWILVVLGNVLRATALFYIETGLIPMPAWVHNGTGLLIFVLIAAGVAASGAGFFRNNRRSERICG